MRVRAALLLIAVASVSMAGEPPASNPVCAWALATHLSKMEVAEMDPSDATALQDLFQRIYADPDRKLGAEDRAWVREYRLEKAVEDVRSAGRKLAAQTRAEKLKYRAAVAVGVSVPVLMLGRWVHAILTEQADLAGELNREYGLHIETGRQSDLRLLKKTLECSPRSSKETRAYLERANLPSNAKILTLDLVFGAYRDPTQDAIIHQKLARIYRRTGIAFCTRWGHESFHYWRTDEIDGVAEALDAFPPDVLQGLRDLHGIVRVSPAYQPRGQDKMVLGIYVPKSKSIDIYTPTGGGDKPTLVHEIGHAVSDEQGIGTSLKWRSINWRFDPLMGYQPKDQNWWPPYNDALAYAKTNPEENWGEAVKCYFAVPGCGAEMKAKNPAMYDYVRGIFQTDPVP